MWDDDIPGKVAEDSTVCDESAREKNHHAVHSAFLWPPWEKSAFKYLISYLIKYWNEK